jgi:hypothetical protein
MRGSMAREAALPVPPAFCFSLLVPDDATADPVFEALWQRVLEAWDADPPHHALLDYAIRAERLADAAGRYRALEGDAEKGARARKRLDAIVMAATQMMMAMKTPAAPRKVPLPFTIATMAFCFALLAWLAWVVFHRHR